MTKLDEMWAALAAYQPQADDLGHGDSWAAMCQEKTTDAARDASSYAASYVAAADAAADASEAVYAATWASSYAAYATSSADNAEKLSQRAIDRISKVLKVAEPVALAEQPAMTEELKPCPFCGRRVEHVSRACNGSATGMTYIVSCFCGSYCACAHQQEDTLGEVVKAWNTRTPPQPAPVQQEPESWAMEFISNMLKTQPANSLLASQVFHELAAQLNRRALPQALAEQPAPVSHTNGARALLIEAIQAHKAYAADKPWMKKPRPICVDVADLESLLAERDSERERCALLCEAHAGMRGTGAWVALTAASDRIRGLIP